MNDIMKINEDNVHSFIEMGLRSLGLLSPNGEVDLTFKEHKDGFYYFDTRARDEKKDPTQFELFDGSETP